jgi:hypothetical protein
MRCGGAEDEVLGEGHGGAGQSESKDARFRGGEEKMMWPCGTHELRRRTGELLEQIVF